MCGLIGGWSRRHFGLLRGALPAMGASLYHRGPSDGGHWWDAEMGIALAHRRLAIVDLSAAGHQPMHSFSERWVIAFNGEIYNHLDLRRELDREGGVRSWRGHSDTETILAAVEAWGVEETLRRSTGMFALALWDRLERCLWLVRDRFGEKPLYYGWHRGVFLFGSELKAFRRMPGFDACVDRGALGLYLRHKAIPAPFSIYKGIYKLLPGHSLRLGLDQLEAMECPVPQPYWLAGAAAAKGRAEPFCGSSTEAADALEELLRNSISRQMVADVPLGAFLSGGVDSSLVVALMQSQSSRPVHTFAIGFEEAEYNEAGYAASVAKHLSTDHTELYVTSQDAITIIPELPNIYDEPFADSSQIPTYALSRLARQKVTVALSGDGGDELFCGYSRYLIAEKIWGRVSPIPQVLRRIAATGIKSISVQKWDRFYQMLEPLFLTQKRRTLIGDKLHKGAEVLTAPNGMAFYRNFISDMSPGVLLSGIDVADDFGPSRGTPLTDLTEYMMLEDACHYMPDDILVKVDRAAMACSLETRIPLLDHEIFEFAWRLPLQHKVKDGVGKHVLRNVLYRYVPQSLIERPKKGFGVPIDAWLRGPLKDWAADLLDPSRLRDEGYFNPEPIQRKWREHLSGERNWQSHLWSILMFQAWLKSTQDLDA
jgi:asparagine synthase (glutamine-hydrolysing)